jgi:hypothetical protein
MACTPVTTSGRASYKLPVLRGDLTKPRAGMEAGKESVAS